MPGLPGVKLHIIPKNAVLEFLVGWFVYHYYSIFRIGEGLSVFVKYTSIMCMNCDCDLQSLYNQFGWIYNHSQLSMIFSTDDEDLS